MFIPGRTYVLCVLHTQYGGRRRGGISIPSHHPIIFLFSGSQGEQYSYRDGWTKGAVSFMTID